MSPWELGIFLLAGIIIVGAISLIGAAVFGIDKGFVIGMRDPDYARGVITYLFAIVTIGTAVALVFSALAGLMLTKGEDFPFERGKHILALLLGVFGTIVGFYL